MDNKLVATIQLARAAARECSERDVRGFLQTDAAILMGAAILADALDRAAERISDAIKTSGGRQHDTR